MIFIDNKYSQVYFLIVKRAKNRKLQTYTESHHIIPKSLGGSNDKDNLVDLTAREHFICHRLLTKMTIGIAKQKMTFAAWALTMRNQYREKIKISSRTYEFLKEERAKILIGKPLPEERRQKLRDANLGKPCSEEKRERIRKSNTGKKQSEETKRRRAISRTGFRNTPETIEKMRRSAKAFVEKRGPMPEEQRQKIREARSKQKIVTVQVTCPYCGKTGGNRIMPRYHFDKCKFK
jgi:5-methylcytosine-specific restriction endonuclease McrA